APENREAQEPLRVARLRRRVQGGRAAASDAVLDGADERRAPARGLGNRGDEVGGRRLAVRARDADQLQLARGVALDLRGGERERAPRVFDLNPRAVESRRALALRDDGDGPALKRLRDEPVRVEVLAG